MLQRWLSFDRHLPKTLHQLTSGDFTSVLNSFPQVTFEYIEWVCIVCCRQFMLLINLPSVPVQSYSTALLKVLQGPSDTWVKVSNKAWWGWGLDRNGTLTAKDSWKLKCFISFTASSEQTLDNGILVYSKSHRHIFITFNLPSYKSSVAAGGVRATHSLPLLGCWGTLVFVQIVSPLSGRFKASNLLFLSPSMCLCLTLCCSIPLPYWFILLPFFKLFLFMFF